MAPWPDETACRVLRVDLSREKARVEELSDEECRLFLGGKSLGYYLAYREIPPGTDPLSPGNKIVFSAGFLGAVAPGASKVSVVSKSPLTRLLHDSHAGDFFGPMLRRAGYKAIIVEGRLRGPGYIWIRDDEVEIRDASQIWGKTVSEATEAVRRETMREASVAAIGPAGERLVRIAHIAFDIYRAAGRGGLGAVMGSKNLKAIAVYGTRKPRVADPDRLRLLRDYWYRHFSESPRYMDIRTYGTTNALEFSAAASMSPSYNFRRPWIPPALAERLSGDAVKSLETEPPWYIHGASCPVKCARYVRAKYGDTVFEVKPEYENLAMLGAATGVFKLEAVLYYNWLVDELGLDSISAGNTIAWFLELVEEGLVDPREWGLDAKGFGDERAVLELLRMMAERRGIGAILAEGVKRASEILGIGAERAVHVKGLEAPAWDPRGRRALGVSYATADVGASHLRGWPSPHEPPTAGPAKELVPSMARNRDRDALLDTMGICRFVSYPLSAIVDLVEAYTGWRPSEEELLDAPRRAEALARIHDALDWLTPPLHDTVPPRWMEPIPEGPLAGVRAFLDWDDLRDAVREYYRLRGWDEDLGVPLPETLERLGLGFAVEDAKRALEAVRKRLG